MFNFGSATATSSASSAPLFSFSAPSSGFGATTSSSTFGASPSSGSLFQWGSSTPAAGASNATPTAGLFGAAPAATSTSLFGSSTTPSLFGSSTTSSLFGASAPAVSAPSLFGAATGAAATASQPFGAFGSTFGGGTGGLFGGSAPATGSSLFPASLAHQQAATVLTAKEGKPLTHITKWDEISDSGQTALLELEKAIAQQREDCRQLDNNQRLWGDEGRQLKKDIAEDEAVLHQALRGLQAALQGDMKSLSTFREKALALLHDTEVAVRTFQRSHRWRTAGKVLPGQALPPGIREQLNGPVVLPSAFLSRAVTGFQETLEQYRQVVAEVEALLPSNLSSQRKQASLPVDILPTVLHNLHDFFCHVAARLEKLHDAVAVKREEYLARLQQAGSSRDPFKEAERAEQLRKEAQQQKTTVIPPSQPQQLQTLPATAVSQPLLQLNAPTATNAGGLFGNTATATPSLFGSDTPAATTSLFGGNAVAGATTPPFGGSLPATSGSAFGGFNTGATSLFSNAQSTPAAGTATSGTRRGRSRK